MIDHDTIQRWLDEVMDGRAPLYIRGPVQVVVTRALREAAPEDYRIACENAAMACEAVTIEAEYERDATLRELEQEREIVRQLRAEKQRLLATVTDLRKQLREQEPPSVRRALAYKVGFR